MDFTHSATCKFTLASLVLPVIIPILTNSIPPNVYYKASLLTNALQVNYLLTIEVYYIIKMMNTNRLMDMSFIQHIEEVVEKVGGRTT